VKREEQPSCCFDDWAAMDARRARRDERAVGVTAPLLEALDDAGLRDRSLLDVGCGAGELVLAALARSARSAHGIDLGPGAVDHARDLAHRRGLAGRATFEIGDGSATTLPTSDVVVLNRVVCCYPDVDALLRNSLAAATSVYAFTAPTDHGPAGVWNRIEMWAANHWYRLRRRKFRSFRTYVHSVGGIDATVRDAGFSPLRRERHRMVWELAVYTREGGHA
jgi:magnesium-protoporphyrin O-methyltransferase